MISAEVLSIITFASFLLTIACMADGPESFENVPTTWVIIICCIPGGIMLILITLFFIIIASPFTYMNYLWRNR